MSSISLTVIGSTLAPFTNFISLSVTDISVIIKGYVTQSNIDDKTETCIFAYTSYNKIPIQLKSYVNGILYDEKVFLTDT